MRTICKLLLFALLLKVANSDTININDTISSFSHEIKNWVEREETAEFQQLIHRLALPTHLQQTDWRSFVGEMSSIACILCKSILNTFMEYRKKGMSAEVIRSKGIEICSKLNLQTEQVCRGAITINLPIILYIIDSKHNLTGSTICGILLESENCPIDSEEFNWTIKIDSSPPIAIDPEESNETLNIVHITDIHYDPKYEPYGNPQCGEPACCRIGQNDTNTSGRVAGYWGDYGPGCDSPWHTVVDVLDHIKAQHQNISNVYFTGDVVDHGVWETSIEENKKSLTRSYLKIHEIFGNVPVYPILGNHEPHPLNQFAPKSITNDEISTQWLYKMMSDLWIDFGWLPESTRSTILQGGYYTVSPKKGFRIIALNSNICYSYNWWLWYQPRDPGNQLQWLADTLSQAEKDGEFVHILGHVPSSNECHRPWRKEYIRIVKRYGHIIRAQFNGHTHNDELNLFYGGDDNSQINNVAWNGGCTTTYSKLNPNYKLYTVDSKNYAVKDFENWIYNVTLANTNPDQRPLWYKSYSFKEEYGISDSLSLSYDALSAWFTKLANDDSMQIRYYRNFFKRADPSLNEECMNSKQCLRSYVCRIIISLGDQKTKCENNEYP